MRAVVFNLGCKVNQYESDYLSQLLSELGFEVSQELAFADVYIINTCAVTAEAERKSRQAIARCKFFNPDARIFVCGCASQKSPSSFERDNVIYVCGTKNKPDILEHLNDSVFSTDIDKEDKVEHSMLKSCLRTRAFVKLQDGCNNFCSYCTIPYLRGRSRSRDLSEVVDEIKLLSRRAKEIVLVGINVMAYGRDNGTSLVELVRALRDVDARIRLSSFYAEGITAELLDALFSLKSFCPHFHLSLQSGDAKVLRDMNRHYTPDDYAQKIELIRSYEKNSFIAADIITGYPTEGEENHRNTVDFINKIGFSDIHVFPFSRREGTRAWSLKSLPAEIVKERRDELLRIKKKSHSDFLQANIGIKHKVLIEENSGEVNCGFSPNYIKFYTKQGRIGDVVECVAGGIHRDGLKED